MSGLLNTIGAPGSKRLAALAFAAAGAYFSLGAIDAQAGEYRGRGDRHDYRHDRDRSSISIGIELGGGNRRADHGHVHETRVWVEPVYRTICDRVWVEAEYRTVCEKVWVAPVTKVVCEKVWHPDRYEVRTVVRRDHFGRLVRCEERILVERGHYDTIERVIEVAPGHFDTVERRELVCEGHWKTIERREVVAPGHWEVRREAVAHRYEDHRTDDFRIGFECRKR